ncbi:hypothetical protein TRVL_03364 [Trypanosoma vivax]|nr:hypothetical protein TRVL_03364 [Trypanosoma vivax]
MDEGGLGLVVVGRCALTWQVRQVRQSAEFRPAWQLECGAGKAGKQRREKDCYRARVCGHAAEPGGGKRGQAQKNKQLGGGTHTNAQEKQFKKEKEQEQRRTMDAGTENGKKRALLARTRTKLSRAVLQSTGRKHSTKDRKNKKKFA